MRHLLLATIFAAGALPAIQAGQLPRQAPDLPIKLPSGETFRLSQYRGKVVALEFLLTTCSHCQRSSQVLNKLQKEYGPKGFQALGVAINPMANMLVPDYVRDYQLTFPVGADVQDVANDFLQHSVMERMMMPQLVLIDREGVIRYQYSGNDPFFAAGKDEQNAREKIEELLKAPMPTSAPAKKAPAKKKVS